MKAMVLHAQAPIETSPHHLLETKPIEPRQGEVLVKVRACAIRRTDLHIIEGDLVPRKLPLIPGHQIVGIVEQLACGCNQFKIGQRVGIAWLGSTDGNCLYCRQCGEKTCLAFALRLWGGQVRPDDCLPIFEGEYGHLKEAFLEICMGLGMASPDV